MRRCSCFKDPSDGVDKDLFQFRFIMHLVEHVASFHAVTHISCTILLGNINSLILKVVFDDILICYSVGFRRNTGYLVLLIFSFHPALKKGSSDLVCCFSDRSHAIVDVL